MNMPNKITIGVFAHANAGKTTVTEQLLNSFNKEAIAWGVERFTKLSHKVQEVVFERIHNNSGLVAVLNVFTYTQLQKISGPSHFVQTKIDERLEQEEKENRTRAPLELNA